MRAGDVDILAFLWDSLPKTEDGQHVIYTDADIAMLWHAGFIDTEHFSLPEWTKAMQPFRNDEGLHFLTRSQFLDIERYRYKGEIFAPFDARDINEGLYTDEGFQDLVDASIAPECGLPSAELQQWLTKFCDDVRQEDKLLRIDGNAKAQIAKLLESDPSPLRRLEMLFMATIKDRKIPVEIDGAPSATTPEAIAKAQASTFALLSGSTDDDKHKALQALENAKLPDNANPAQEDAPSVSLKDIRRNPRGMKS